MYRVYGVLFVAKCSVTFSGVEFGLIAVAGLLKFKLLLSLDPETLKP